MNRTNEERVARSTAYKDWPTLSIDRRDLPLIIEVKAKNGEFKSHEITVTNSDREGHIKLNIRQIGFDGRVEVSSEFLDS